VTEGTGNGEEWTSPIVDWVLGMVLEEGFCDQDEEGGTGRGARVKATGIKGEKGRPRGHLQCKLETKGDGNNRNHSLRGGNCM